MLLYGEDRAVAAFVAALMPHGGAFGDNSRAIGVVHKNKLIGGLVYHDWNPQAGVIEISGAATSPRWLSRKNIHFMLAYPFEDCGCQMVVMRTSEHNKRVQKVITGIGFDALRIPRLYGRDEDGILLTLTDDAWKSGRFYLKE